MRCDTTRERWGKEGNQERLGLSEIMWEEQTGALNQQTHVLVGCISRVLWKCGCWELNVKGQQHTTLRAQSRASWRSAIVIWEGRGREAHTTDETHSYRKGWALWLLAKPTNPVGVKENPWEIPWSADTLPQSFATHRKTVLGLDWYKSLHLSGLVLNSDIKDWKGRKNTVGKKSPSSPTASKKFGFRCSGTCCNSGLARDTSVNSKKWQQEFAGKAILKAYTLSKFGSYFDYILFIQP